MGASINMEKVGTSLTLNGQCACMQPSGLEHTPCCDLQPSQEGFTLGMAHREETQTYGSFIFENFYWRCKTFSIFTYLLPDRTQIFWKLQIRENQVLNDPNLLNLIKCSEETARHLHVNWEAVNLLPFSICMLAFWNECEKKNAQWLQLRTALLCYQNTSPEGRALKILCKIFKNQQMW